MCEKSPQAQVAEEIANQIHRLEQEIQELKTRLQYQRTYADLLRPPEGASPPDGYHDLVRYQEASDAANTKLPGDIRDLEKDLKSWKYARYLLEEAR